MAQDKGNTFVGKPCRNGHSSVRYISNGYCAECSRAWHTKNYDREKERLRKRAYRNRFKVNTHATREGV